MERDFMGLNSKEPLAVVKEETTDAVLDSGSGVPWSFMNKVSAAPHLMSFKAGQDDRTKKMVDAFDCSRVSSATKVQSLQLTSDVKMSIPDQTIAFPMSNPFFKHNFATSGQHLVGGPMRQSFIGGVPMTSSLGPIVGVTEPWNNFKASTAPCQMTVFYAGTVCVYDDISPEKAQAIMLLAGNGCSLPFNMAHQRPQVQAPTTKLAAADAVVVNQPLNSQPCPGLSRVSVSPHNAVQSGSAPASNDETLATKVTGISPSTVSKPQPQVASVLPQIALKTMKPSAVPQFRKASLARFLEKRKERVMSAAPYDCDKKFSEGAVPGNDDTPGISATSAANSGSGKEK
ncbi:hypothetical protein Ancab_018403 [Ancistrocladus abbreviatus]